MHKATITLSLLSFGNFKSTLYSHFFLIFYCFTDDHRIDSFYSPLPMGHVIRYVTTTKL